GHDVDDNSVEAGDAGEPTPVSFEFLDFAFAVGGADDECVIVGAVRFPIETPKHPGQFCSGIIDLRVGPGFAVVVANLDAGNAAIPAERDAFDLNRRAVKLA